MDPRKAHWEGVYASKREDEVSWYQERPGSSLELIRRCRLAPGARVIDVGGGASRLVDGLLDQGLAVTVLDLAGAALARTRARLGARAAQADWIEADITAWSPAAPFDLWHDRAVFHFLTDAADRAAYRERLLAGTRSGSFVVIGTFAQDGPERCSGLPVARYSAGQLAAELGKEFVLVDELNELHATPAGKNQSFQFCRFHRT